MDQGTFLSRTLWEFFEASAFTDVTLACKDGEVSAHSPIIAAVFPKSGSTFFSANFERPQRLLMPDFRFLSFSFFDVTLSLLCLYKSSRLEPTFYEAQMYKCIKAPLSQVGRSERVPPRALP